MSSGFYVFVCVCGHNTEYSNSLIHGISDSRKAVTLYSSLLHFAVNLICLCHITHLWHNNEKQTWNTYLIINKIKLLGCN